MSEIIIAEANNSEGSVMRFEFEPTRSWQAFMVRGVPRRLSSMEGKALSLAKAVQIWNVSIGKRVDALQTVTISATIRERINEARDARTAANKTKPVPLFQ